MIIEDNELAKTYLPLALTGATTGYLLARAVNSIVKPCYLELTAMQIRNEKIIFDRHRKIADKITTVSTVVSVVTCTAFAVLLPTIIDNKLDQLRLTLIELSLHHRANIS